MLPFHKRSRANSSIEIGTDELEAIELPRARPPSVRPSYVMRPQLSFARNDDEEMTVIRMDKRPSSAPPPSSRSLQDVRIPRNPPPPSFARPDFERPSYDNDEPTMLHPSSSSRPLLSMSSFPPPPPSSRLLDDAPRATGAVDASSSYAQRMVDLSMTSSSSGSADLSQLRRPSMGWAAGLVVAGVFAGIVGAFIARGEGLAAAASLVDPSAHVTADVAHVAAPAQVEATKVQAPAPLAAGAAAPQTIVQTQKPAAPSCNAEAAPVAPVAKVESPKIVERVVERAAPPPVQRVAAPPPVVRHAEPAQVAVAAPPPAITKPARPASKRGGDDIESASAADALAKAQLDAALSR